VLIAEHISQTTPPRRCDEGFGWLLALAAVVALALLW
jgi:hypothetical protein